MPFTKSWDELGWQDPEAGFYEINYTPFGGIPSAVPRQCADAIGIAGENHRVVYDREVRWQLVAVAENQPLVENKIFSGNTSYKKSGCVEHTLWPEVRQGVYQRLFILGQTLVIYTTLTPCLKCYNSLIGISRLRDMNILVRCQEDYDFLGGNRERKDFWVMIPRAGFVTSAASPARKDKVVFVLHNGNMDFSKRRTGTFKGSMQPAKFYTEAHRDKAGLTCGNILVTPGNNDDKNGKCQSCKKEVKITRREGSGTPWAQFYVAANLQNRS